MASFAQVVAAVAAGALLTVTAMLMFKVYELQRRPRREQGAAERERKIESVADASVETFLQQFDDAARRLQEEDADGPAPDAIEVWSKAHLRMLVDGESSATAPWPGAACGRARPNRVTRRRPVPKSRP